MMLHIFISYARKDGGQYLDELILRLKQAGFKDEDFWIDQLDIEPGEEWRDAIDTALRESFIAVVILTPSALESHFVTYEWSRALGDGLKVVPIIFENLTSEVNHPLLDRKQYVNWNEPETPHRVIETMRHYQKLSPDILLLNRRIADIITPFRILMLVSTWLTKYLNTNLVETEIIVEFMKLTIDKAQTVASELTEFLVDKAAAFTSRQRRKCRELIENTDKLADFRRLSPDYPLFFYAQYFQYIPNLLGFAKEIETAIEFFSPEYDQAGWGNSFYLLQTHLKLNCNSNCDLISKRYIEHYLPPQIANGIIPIMETIGKNHQNGEK